ncbi:hypothetical protein CDAR_309631 [Caerostris darwini]|uniref:Uncharacterized protein n=1 Tax=Caerostris darwini TaxID=1538125 RepID=A0AAV4VY79_9ARAC|nr:hypothetical protein CDAR_309631 [Caerostris darwini]
MIHGLNQFGSKERAARNLQTIRGLIFLNHPCSRTHYRLSHCLVSDSEVPKHTAEVPLVRCTERKGTLKNSAGRSDKRGSDSNHSLFWKGIVKLGLVMGMRHKFNSPY